MYINKVIFQEASEFTNDEYDTLVDENIICHTDYGTTEILKDRIQELEELNAKEELEILTERLGTDVMDLFRKDELDFVLVV